MPGDIDIGFLQHFEQLLDNAGSINDPVVDVWYDLNMVKEVVDVPLFLEELAQIRRWATLTFTSTSAMLIAPRIIDDAEERLGIRAAREAAAAERKELHARLAEQAKLRSEHAPAHKRSLLKKVSGSSSGFHRRSLNSQAARQVFCRQRFAW